MRIMSVFLRFALVIWLPVALTACSRPAVTGLSDTVPEAVIERVFVATQRTRNQLGQIFGEKRSSRMQYATIDVSIPPRHELGQLERTRGEADAGQYFAPVAVEALDGSRDFTRALGRSRGGDGGVLLFVHGYNNTLEDAVFRVAQIKHDFDIEEPAILFSWPSAGDPRGYVYDRDSVLFARDGFVELLRDLHAAGQRRILLVAHSMGGYLTMEVLRQIALEGDRHLFGGLEAVILMSPDIDPDIFRQQAAAIAREASTLARPPSSLSAGTQAGMWAQGITSCSIRKAASIHTGSAPAPPRRAEVSTTSPMVSGSAGPTAL